MFTRQDKTSQTAQNFVSMAKGSTHCHQKTWSVESISAVKTPSYLIKSIISVIRKGASIPTLVHHAHLVTLVKKYTNTHVR